jgi:hypothetical protein
MCPVRCVTYVSGRSKSCNAHDCSFQITLNEFLLGSLRNLFEKLDDYFRLRLKLSYNVGPFVRLEYSLLQTYVRLGGRPAKVIANIGMRDGLMLSKGIHVWVETYGHPAGWSGNDRLEFALFADAYSVPRFEYFDGQYINPELTLHPDYAIGAPDACTVCVVGWAKFTSYADPSEIRRLMQLD